MLEAHDLAARRGTAHLFGGIAFRVEPGQVLVVTGPNGSGKTTLLRILAGLTAPAAGELRWKGRDVLPFDAQLRADVLFAGHHPSLKDEFTAEENLASLTALAGERSSAEAIRAALDAVGLARRRTLPARALSQGQRRRIGLARLRLVERPLWLLDEPVTALDADGVDAVRALISDHLARGGMAVAATHQDLTLPKTAVRHLALH